MAVPLVTLPAYIVGLNYEQGEGAGKHPARRSQAAFERCVFGGENISNQAVDRAIDCIISAALLEIAAIQEEAMLPKRKIYNGSNG